jgi:hypothetical protein
LGQPAPFVEHKILSVHSQKLTPVLTVICAAILRAVAEQASTAHLAFLAGATFHHFECIHRSKPITKTGRSEPPRIIRNASLTAILISKFAFTGSAFATVFIVPRFLSAADIRFVLSADQHRARQLFSLLILPSGTHMPSCEPHLPSCSTSLPFLIEALLAIAP